MVARGPARAFQAPPSPSLDPLKQRDPPTDRSMWSTFLPSTESSPERTHSVRPVPRMICVRAGRGEGGLVSE